MQRIVLIYIFIALSGDSYCQKQILLKIDSSLTNANIKINTVANKIDSNTNYLSRFDAHLIKIIQNGNETDLQKYDQIGSVLSSFLSFIAILITIYLGYLTYKLTIKYGENQSELEVLRRAYLDNYIPYIDVTHVEYKDSFLIFKIQNLGGYLENLEINPISKSSYSIDFGEHFPSNMGKFGSFQKQIHMSNRGLIEGLYDLTYENRFKDKYQQKLQIIQTKNDIKFEVTPPVLLQEGIKIFND